MSATPNLGLPLLAAAQAQKHVTHNEALYAIDALLQCAILDKDLALPPVSPASGARYIVGAGAGGVWAGRAGTIAAWQDGEWLYLAPRVGYLAYVVDEALLYVFTGSGWVSLTAALGSLQNLGLLGLGTTADAPNPLSAKLNKALWTAREIGQGGTGDLRYVLNKEAAGNVLSLLFQSGFSGRLELGLIGSDQPAVKVSPDGATWQTALTIDAASGGVDFRSGEAALASAATTDLGSVPHRRVAITGSAAVTSFGPATNRERLLSFTGTPTLVHDAVSLILPGGASIATDPGDTAYATSDGAGRWTVRHYGRASGAAIAGSRRNRIADPGFMVSQESGSASLALGSGTLHYPSDSVFLHRVGSSGGATVQRVASASPGGSPYRHRVTITAANASPGGGDCLNLRIRIEGLDVADLLWGTAAAKAVTLAVPINVPVAGTYGVAVQNGIVTRSWVGSVTIAAGEVGQDVVKHVTVPGDTTGTWAKDANVGLEVFISLCAGSGSVGTSGWQAGNKFAPTGCVNVMATNGAVFDLLGRVGLYEGNVPPPFELPAFDDALQKCQRYYETGVYSILGQSYATNAYLSTWIEFHRPKRVAPSITFLTSTQFANATTPAADRFTVDGTRIITMGTGASTYVEAAGTFSANARL